MKKFFKKNKKIIITSLICLILLIVGSLIISFVPTILLMVLIGMIYFFVNSKKKVKKGEIFKSIMIFCFSFAIFCLLLGISFGIYIIATAPDFTEEKLYNKDASILYLANGEEFAKVGAEMREKVTYDELSQSLIDAIIATEDSRFFQHSGVDLPRFLKASFTQLLGKGGGGASTLTMQVSKNTQTSTIDSGIQGIIRKFTDIYMSVFKIETKYTKEEILEFYANSFNLGGSNRGVEQASLDYFGKHASELNIAEAAMIAGLYQAPGAYYPYLYPEACEQRRQTVLSLMLRHGYINEEEYNIAKELTVDKLLVKKEASSDTSKKKQAVILQVFIKILSIQLLKKLLIEQEIILMKFQ